MDFINTLMPNFERLSGELYECIGQTFTMLAVSGSIAWVLGVAVGVLLTVCRPGGILENRWLFTIVDRGIDIIRSIPFIILIVLLIPVSRFLVGTGSGVTGPSSLLWPAPCRSLPVRSNRSWPTLITVSLKRARRWAFRRAKSSSRCICARASPASPA